MVIAGHLGASHTQKIYKKKELKIEVVIKKGNHLKNDSQR